MLCVKIVCLVYYTFMQTISTDYSVVATIYVDINVQC